MSCFKEKLQDWLDKNAPKLIDDFSESDRKMYCCEYNLYLERLRLHELAEKVDEMF